MLTDHSRYEKIICDVLKRDVLIARRDWVKAVGTYAATTGLFQRPGAPKDRHGIRAAYEALIQRRREYDDLRGAYNHALTTFLCCHHEGHDDEVNIRPASES